MVTQYQNSSNNKPDLLILSDNLAAKKSQKVKARI